MTVNNKIIRPKRILSNADRARLGELLRKRLIECGWKEQVRRLYHQVVRECRGENISFEMIITKMTPRAHALVPDVVKKEFIKKIIACRGPRILAPKTDNGEQVAQEVPQMEQVGQELAQVVPQGVQYVPEVAQQVPQIDQRLIQLADLVPQIAQQVPQMEH